MIMGMVSTKEVQNLAELARLDLSEEEIERFKGDISSVLDYVDSIRTIEVLETIPEGGRINVLREDAVTNEPGSYTDALLDAAPAREGNLFKVPKILSQDE